MSTKSWPDTDAYEGTYQLEWTNRDEFTEALDRLRSGPCPFVLDVGYSSMVIRLFNHDPNDSLSAAKLLGNRMPSREG